MPLDLPNQPNGVTGQPAGAQAATPAPGGAAFDVIAHLRARGVRDDILQDPAQALDAILGYVQQQQTQLERLQPLATIGQEFAPHASDIRSLVEAGVLGGNAQGAAVNAAHAGRPQVPQPIDPRVEAMLEQTANGRFKAPSTMPELQRYADQANAFLDHQREFLGGFSADPLGHLRKSGLDGLLSEQEKKIEKMIAEGIAKARAQDEEQNFYREKRKDFVETIDPVTGQPKFTARGEAFNKYLAEAAEFTDDPAKQRKYAIQHLERDDKAGVFTNAAATPGQGVPGQPGNASVNRVATDAQGQAANKAKFLDRVQANSQADPSPAPSSGGDLPANDPAAVNADRLLDNLVNEEVRAHGLTPRSS